MQSAWERIGGSSFGGMKQQAIGEYSNIKALMQEMPSSSDPQSREVVTKAQGALRDGMGINKNVAVYLNEALADPEARAAIVQMSQNNPAALSKAIDQMKDHPEEIKTIVAGIKTEQQVTQVSKADTAPPDRADSPSQSEGAPSSSSSKNEPSSIEKFFEKIAKLISKKVEEVIIAIVEKFGSKHSAPGEPAGQPTEPVYASAQQNDTTVGVDALTGKSHSQVMALAASLRNMGVLPTVSGASDLKPGVKKSGGIEIS